MRILIVALALLIPPTASAHKMLPRHKPFSQMTLVQLRDYQALTLHRDANVITWWRSYRTPPARGLAFLGPHIVALRFPSCLGARMPREVCWHYRHRSWTLPLYRKTLARLKAAAAPVIPRDLLAAFTCIHGGEGAWDANTGNGYYGGLQMDIAFQSRWGPDYLSRYGTADRWTPAQQIEVAIKAYRGLGSFGSWPNTARACGLY